MVFSDKGDDDRVYAGPVRIECLTDTVGETAITITGTFGGTTTSDRTAAVREAHRSYKCDLPAYIARDEREIRSQAAATLEASFPERLEGWRMKVQEDRHEPVTVTAAAPRPARSACQRCGNRLAWWRRSDAAYCSAACRQASYRLRVADLNHRGQLRWGWPGREPDLPCRTSSAQGAFLRLVALTACRVSGLTTFGRRLMMSRCPLVEPKEDACRPLD